MDPHKYCVYNQGRESFLSLGVMVVDSALKQMKALIEDVSVKSDNGLWLMPFRGIPASRGLAPVDLIYLDEENHVILTVESFPNNGIESLKVQPASVLVLAAHTIYSSQTQAGDLLLICAAEEMQRRLERFPNGFGPISALPEVDQMEYMPSEDIPFLNEELTADRATELQVAHQRLLEKDNAEAEALQNASWFVKFLRWLSTDRRASKRHPLPGLVAYYWTGGAPEAFHIGDISGHGLYLLTDERWYPGTMILMTLQRTNTDGDDPDDFISVLTRVVRWGTDGLGLSFVPSNTVDLNTGAPLPDMGVGKKALNRFIQRVQATS
jgi:PilZ domain